MIKEGFPIGSVIAVLAVLIMGLIIIFAVLFPGGLAARGQQSMLTVSATGTAAGYPDQAILYVEVNGSGSSSQVATANISLTLAELNSTMLRYIDHNTSNIQTVSYSLSKPYNSLNYVADEEMKVTIPSVSNATPAIGALSSISNVYISGASSQLSGQQAAALRTQALSAALANATGQAHALLGSNVSLQMRNITVNSYNVNPYPVVALSTGSGSASPSFFAGTEGVTETVTVSYSYS